MLSTRDSMPVKMPSALVAVKVLEAGTYVLFLPVNYSLFWLGFDGVGHRWMDGGKDI